VQALSTVRNVMRDTPDPMPSAREVGPRYATCIHEPPIDGVDAAPSEEDVARADAKHPPDKSHRQDKKPRKN
jgi:hypothetical protein